jgi:hypothetical protein
VRCSYGYRHADGDDRAIRAVESGDQLSPSDDVNIAGASGFCECFSWRKLTMQNIHGHDYLYESVGDSNDPSISLVISLSRIR